MGSCLIASAGRILEWGLVAARHSTPLRIPVAARCEMPLQQTSENCSLRSLPPPGHWTPAQMIDSFRAEQISAPEAS